MPEWYEGISQAVTIEVEKDGAKSQVPVRDHEFVKSSPNLDHFVKRAFDNHAEVGRRIPVSVKDDAERKTWRETHLPTLHKAGLIEAPAADPKEYTIKMPEADKIPKGLKINDEAVGKFRGLLHKHGISAKSTLGQELLDLQMEVGAGQMEVFKGSSDEAMKALKEEFKDEFDGRFEAATRLMPVIFKTKEELDLIEKSGIGNHPTWLGLLMRLAPLALADSSVLPKGGGGGGGGQMTREQVAAEMTKIMTNKEHPMYEGYWRNDPETMRQIEEMYKKVAGDGKIIIS